MHGDPRAPLWDRGASDSLALDEELRVNGPVVQFFGERKGATFGAEIEMGFHRPPEPCLNPYVVVSFSVAPQRMIDAEEKDEPRFQETQGRSKRAQDWGCFVGLHFDPVVIYEGFEKDYADLIDEIAGTLDLKRVIWVSVGCLRFTPPLMKLFLRERRANLLHGEFIMGEDGKFRYLKAERIKVYRMLYGRLLEKEPGLFVYLCMERADVWRQATGREIETSEDLTTVLTRE